MIAIHCVFHSNSHRDSHSAMTGPGDATKSQTFTAKPGQSLMKAALAASIDGIAADCGGSLTCATCHVYVEGDWLARLPPASKDELVMLEMTAAPRAHNSRLSCQLVMQADLNGLSVTLPPTQY